MISNWNLGDYIKTAFLDLQYALGLPNPSSDNGVEAINRAAGINENNNQTVTVSKSDVHHNTGSKIVDTTDVQNRIKQFINNTWVEYVGDDIWIPSDILKNKTQKEISALKRRPPDDSLKYLDNGRWMVCSNSYWMPIGLKERAEKNWMDIDEYVNAHKNGKVSKIVDTTDVQNRIKQFINNTWVEYVGDDIWIPSDILKNRTQKEISMMKRRPPDGSLKYYDDASWSICSNSYWMPIGLKEQAEKNWMDIDEYVNAHKNGKVSNPITASEKKNSDDDFSEFEDFINCSTKAFREHFTGLIEKFFEVVRNLSASLADGNDDLEGDMVDAWKDLLKKAMRGEKVSNCKSYKLLRGCGVTDDMFSQLLGLNPDAKAVPKNTSQAEVPAKRAPAKRGRKSLDSAGKTESRNNFSEFQSFDDEEEND